MYVERIGKGKLPRGGVQQVGTTYDLIDALVVVIHDDRELIGKEAVFALDDNITDIGDGQP